MSVPRRFPTSIVALFATLAPQAAGPGPRRAACRSPRVAIPVFSDWPPLAKFALAPAMAAALLLAVAALGIAALHGARTETRSIVALDMDGNDRLARAAGRFQRLDADLYHLLARRRRTRARPRSEA